MVLEELEARVLLSTWTLANPDPGVAVEEQTLSPEDVELLTSARPKEAPKSFDDADAIDGVGDQQISGSTRELIFVDGGVDDYDQLLFGLAGSVSDSREIEVVVLDSDRDGIQQISEILAERNDLDAVHFIAHGNDGRIEFGNTVLNAVSLDERAAEISAWSSALDEEGDLLFYGCELAATDAGKDLVSSLGELTGADVAASDDLTGAVALGGDWDLEYRVGQIEASLFSGSVSSWQGVLGTVVTASETQNGDIEVKSTDRHGQTFSHTSGEGTYTVDQLSLQLRGDADAPAQNVTVSLRDSWNGTVLGSATIAAGDLETTLTWESFGIGDTTLNDGQTYTIRVETDSMDGKVYLGFDDASAYASGDRLDNTGSPILGEDFAFRVEDGFEPSPIAHWKFDADASDSSGNNYDGIVQGDAAIDPADATDKIGDAKLSLDGTGDYVSLDSHASTLNGLTQGTITAWVNLTNAGENTILGLSDQDQPQELTKFGIESGQVKWLNVNDAFDDVIVYSTPTVNDGTWHHIAVTVDATGNSIYIDGVLASVLYADGSPTTTSFFDDITDADAFDIGRSVRDGLVEGEFSGLLDDVRIYDLALSADELAALVATPPVAVDDTASTMVDTPIVIDVTANDIVNQSGSIVVVEVSEPTNGAVVNNNDGTVTYTPDASYTGADSFTYKLADTDAGLTNYWGLDGDATDAVGGADGTLNGTTTVAGEFGNGLDFDDTAVDHVLIPDVSYGAEFTVSFDFKIDDSSGSLFQYLYSHGDINGVNSVNIFLNEASHGTDPNVLRTVIRDSDDTLDNAALQFDATSLIGSGWHTYTVTAGASGIEVFIDGVSMASDATRGIDGVDPSGSLYLGARNDLNADRSYGGALDSLQIYDTVIDEAQITNIVSDQNIATVNVNVDAAPATPIGHWTFDVDGSDASGNNYHGTLINQAAIDPTDATDIVGVAKLTLDGDEDSLDLSAHVSNFSGLTEGTISGWVNTSAASGGSQTILSVSDSSSGSDYAFFGMRDGQVRFEIGNTSGGTLYSLESTSEVLNDGSWHHIAFSVDGTGNRIYVDGNLVASGDLNYLVGSTTNTEFLADIPGLDAMHIGVREVIGIKNLDFDGLIDDVRVYDSAIDGDEIATLAVANQAPVISSDGGGDTADINVTENDTAVTTVTATDGDLDTPVYSIDLGSDDASFFSIDSGSGVLTFNTAPVFGSSADLDGDNVYEVTVQVSDGNGGLDTQSISVTVVATAPIGHWTFDTDATDSSGNNYHGTLTNGAAIDTTGATNQVGEGKLSVDGTNDYLDLSSHVGSFQNLTEGTVSAWVYAESSSTGAIFSVADSGDSDSRFTLGRSGAGRVQLYVREGASQLFFAESTATEIPLNTWTHVAVSVDDSGNRIFINGSQLTGGDLTYYTGSSSTSTFFDDVPDLDFMAWGTDNSSSSYIFEGLIDEGRIYDTPLTASQIASLSNDPPQITSNSGGATANINVVEDTTAVTTVTADDTDLDTLTYTITGGADAAKFTLNSSSGVLEFTVAPDFETPTDADTDNIYIVEVTVSDGNGGTDLQTLYVGVTDDAVVTYPDSNGTDNSYEWITSVDFADLNSTTGQESGGYADYTAQTATVEIGSSYDLTVNINADSEDYVYAWIDWNHDGDFVDGGEEYVLATNTSSNGPHTVSVTIPGGAALGDTRMRVSIKYQGAPASDELFDFGEVEDYTINVSAVNAAPIAAMSQVSGTEDTPYVFSWSDFNVTDVDSPITDDTAVQIDTLPANGSLEYHNGSSWVGVSAGQILTKAEFDASSVRFVPVSNESGHDAYANPGVGDGFDDYAQFYFTATQSHAIAIVNADAETDGLGEGLYTSPAAGWTKSGADAGAQNFTSAEFSTDHDSALYVNDGSTLSQTLSPFYESNDYSLSLDIGWRGDAGYPTAPDFRVELWAGATQLGVFDQTDVTLVKGQFVAATLAIDGSAYSVADGETLEIRLVGVSTQVNFDNVSLSINDLEVASASATMTIDIAPVNDVPVATGNTVIATEDVALIIDANDFSFTDAESDSLVSATITGLTLNGGILTHSAGAVTVTNGMTVTAAELTDLTFTSALNDSTNSSFIYTVNDAGMGVTSAIMNITVNAVNDSPLVTNLASDELNYTEGDGAVVIEQGGDVTVSDVDSANFAGGSLTVEVDFGLISAEDEISVRNQGTSAGQIGVSGSDVTYGGVVIGSFTGGTGLVPLTITFNSSATPSAVTALVQNITYENVSLEDPTARSLSVTMDITDGDGGASLTQNLTINVAAVNDQAVADLNGSDGGGRDFSTTFTEGLGAVNVTDSDATISDVDNTDYVGLGVNLMGFVDGASEKVTIAGYTFTYGVGETVVGTVGGTDFELDFDGSGFTIMRNLSDNMPQDDLQSLLRGINYENISDNPTTGNRTIDIIPEDGSGLNGLSSTSTISVVAANDPPSVGTTGTTLSYTENDGAVAIDSGLSVSDADNANLTGATVSFTSGFASGEDTIAFVDQLGITGSYDAGTGILTLSGTASVADYETALRSVTYSNSSEIPDTTNRVIEFQVSDGLAVAGGSRTVSVASINDDPTNTGSLPTDVAVTEDSMSSIDFSGFVLEDVDASNQLITVTLTTATGGLITASSDFDVTVFGSGTATMTLVGGVSDINNFFSSASRFWYQHGTQHTAGGNADAVTVSVNDGGNTGTGGGGTITLGTVNVDITPVNDAPVLTAGTVADLVVLEDSGLTSLGLGGLTYGTGGGVDEAVQNLTYEVTVIPDTNFFGKIYLADGTTQVSTGLYSLTDLQGMQFEPVTNKNGGPSFFSFRITDSGGTPNGGADSITETIQLDITPQQDPAVIAGKHKRHGRRRCDGRRDAHGHRCGRPH